MAQLYPVEVRLTRKWSAPSIKHARYGGSLAEMVARGSFNTVSGTASCHYSMQECWSFPRPRTLNSCGTTAKWRHGSRPPAPSQSSNRRPWFPRNRTEGLSTRGGAVVPNLPLLHPTARSHLDRLRHAIAFAADAPAPEGHRVATRYRSLGEVTGCGSHGIHVPRSSFRAVNASAAPGGGGSVVEEQREAEDFRGAFGDGICSSNR